MVLIVIGVLVVLILALDLLFAGGGMTLRQAQGRLSAATGGAMQCGAAVMGSPFGWVLIVALILVVLATFGILFGYRG